MKTTATATKASSSTSGFFKPAKNPTVKATATATKASSSTSGFFKPAKNPLASQYAYKAKATPTHTTVKKAYEQTVLTKHFGPNVTHALSTYGVHHNATATNHTVQPKKYVPRR